MNKAKFMIPDSLFKTMDNQQSNLYQQQSQITPPAPENKSDKLWPINWGHNKLLKILGAICFICFLIFLLTSLISLVDRKEDLNIIDKPQTYLDLIFTLIDWLGILSSSVAFIVAVFYTVLSLMRVKKLDKIDKVFFVTSLIFWVAFIFLYIQTLRSFSPPPPVL